MSIKECVNSLFNTGPGQQLTHIEVSEFYWDQFVAEAGADYQNNTYQGCMITPVELGSGVVAQAFLSTGAGPSLHNIGVYRDHSAAGYIAMLDSLIDPMGEGEPYTFWVNHEVRKMLGDSKADGLLYHEGNFMGQYKGYPIRADGSIPNGVVMRYADLNSSVTAE